MQETKKPQAYQRRGEAFWRGTVLAPWDSDSPPRELCRCHGLALATFHRWRRRLGETAELHQVLNHPDFVEVTVRPERATPSPTDGAAGFELMFKSGVCLRLPSQVEGQSLAEVLWALQARDPC